MKITILSRTDYAGSGHKLKDALSLGHDVEIFTGWNKRYLFKNGLGHNNQDNIITPFSRHTIQKRIDKSDVVIIKGDWPMRDKYMRFRIDCPTIQIVSGSNFRKIEHEGRGGFHPMEYKATINTAFIPDLLYPEYGNIWIPHPIDSIEKNNIWIQPKVPVLMHASANWATKGTNFIINVFRAVKKMINVETVLLENMPFNELMEQKKRATILFDQVRVGFYGNNAIEAMQYGIPTMAWISELSRTQAKGQLKDCPIITHDKHQNYCIEVNAGEYYYNKVRWAYMISEILSSDMTELSHKTKLWCDSVHSYEAVLEKCNQIFKML